MIVGLLVPGLDGWFRRSLLCNGFSGSRSIFSVISQEQVGRIMSARPHHGPHLSFLTVVWTHGARFQCVISVASAARSLMEGGFDRSRQTIV